MGWTAYATVDHHVTVLSAWFDKCFIYEALYQSIIIDQHDAFCELFRVLIFNVLLISMSRFSHIKVLTYLMQPNGAYFGCHFLAFQFRKALKRPQTGICDYQEVREICAIYIIYSNVVAKFQLHWKVHYTPTVFHRLNSNDERLHKTPSMHIEDSLPVLSTQT